MAWEHRKKAEGLYYVWDTEGSWSFTIRHVPAVKGDAGFFSTESMYKGAIVQPSNIQGSKREELETEEKKARAHLSQVLLQKTAAS